MRTRAIQLTATGAAGIVLAALLTLMVNWIGARHWLRGDWTSSQLYTLSQTTEGILGNLDSDVHVVVFMTRGSQLYPQVTELLDRYAAATDHISVEYIDPDREPLRTRQLVEQYGVATANTVVFSSQDRTKYVTSDELAELDYGGMGYGQPPRMTAFKGEEKFTAALLSVAEERVSRVYFVTGHGEASLSPAGGVEAERGLQSLKEALKRDNIEAEELSLLPGTIPDDAAAVAIVGPTRMFTDAEVDLLGRFVDGGGRLLVAIDPVFEPGGTLRRTRLEEFLAEHGVTAEDALVIDPARSVLSLDLSAVYLSDFLDHPVTTGLSGMAVLFPVTRPLEAIPAAGWKTQPLVETSDEGWGETNLRQLLDGQPVNSDPEDVSGPVAVAMAVASAPPDGDDDAAAGEDDEAPGEDDGPAARLVVLGDSDFLTDGQIVNLGNLTLALNSIRWLAAREQALGIPPREVGQTSMLLSADQLRLVFLLTVVVLPAASILLGIVVWRRRRH